MFEAMTFDCMPQSSSHGRSESWRKYGDIPTKRDFLGNYSNLGLKRPDIENESPIAVMTWVSSAHADSANGNGFVGDPSG